MMSNQHIEAILRSAGDVDYVEVKGDGYHYQVTVVGDVFRGKSKVARQQWVYSQLNDYIQSGSLHAVSMKTWTKKEWGEQHG